MGLLVKSKKAAKSLSPIGHPLGEPMGIAAQQLSQHVIRPTLLYLDRHDASAEALLLGAAASQSGLGSALCDPHGSGLYRISTQRHQHCWDQYLAHDPELASRVRGLASQHAFLQAPDLELVVNLRYATAIAWAMIEASSTTLPAADDIAGLAHIWRQVFQPRGRLRDFTQAWHYWVASSAQAA